MVGSGSHPQPPLCIVDQRDSSRRLSAARHTILLVEESALHGVARIDASTVELIGIDAQHAARRDQPKRSVGATGETRDARQNPEAIHRYRTLRPDVTLLDLQMPDGNGIDALVAIRAENSTARVIVLTTYAGDARAQRALKAGAQGYILKGMIRKELLDCIRAVHAGHKRIHVEVAAQLAAHLGDDALSERELQVLGHIAGGNSNRQVARLLSISEETVKGHVKAILAKLSATDRTHAVMRAVARGFLQI
jgi:DNA-binding NarL/FixJ family response regulator